jgi:hypothetical protein
MSMAGHATIVRVSPSRIWTGVSKITSPRPKHIRTRKIIADISSLRGVRTRITVCVRDRNHNAKRSRDAESG